VLVDGSVVVGCVELVVPALVVGESDGELLAVGSPAAAVVLADELAVDCDAVVVGSAGDDDDDDGVCPTTKVPESAKITSLTETVPPFPPLA